MGEQQSLQFNQSVPVNPFYTHSEPNQSTQFLEFSQCSFNITSHTCKRPDEPTSCSPGELQSLQCTLPTYSTHPHIRPIDATLSTAISHHHKSIHTIPFTATTITLILIHLYKRSRNLFHHTNTTTPHSHMQQSISNRPMITKSSASADANLSP